MKYHYDKHGNKTLLAELSNGHLSNIIELAIKKLKAAWTVLNEIDKPSSERGKAASSFMKKVYDLPDIDDAGDRALEMVDNVMAILPGYMFEAWLREISEEEAKEKISNELITREKLNEWRAQIQELLGREGQLTPVGDAALTLLGPVDDVLEEYDPDGREVDAEGFIRKAAHGVRHRY